jgi:MFS family permease
VVFFVQVGLGVVLFAVFQQYVPEERGAGAGWGGYLLSAYGSARFVFETPTGIISDRVRRKTGLLLGFLLLVPAVLAMAWAKHVAVFMALSGVLGLGTAFLWPAVYAISADLYPPERRGKVVGFLNVFQLLGFGLGALMGALLVEGAHDAMFLLAISAMGAAGIAAFVGVPGYRHTGVGQRRGIGLREVWSPQLGALSVIVVVATAGVSMIIPAVRPYGDEQLGEPLSTLTIALIPAVLLGGALYVPAGHLSDLMGRTTPFVLGEVLLIAGALLAAATDSLYLAAFAGAVIFAGNVFIVPAFNAAVMDLAPETHRGTLIGLMVALSGLGLALGPAIGGMLLALASPPAVFRVAAMVAFVTLSALLLYTRRYGSLRPSAQPGSA